MAPRSLVVTCEHATNRVPPDVQRLLAGALAPRARRAWLAALQTHRGFDLGARGLALALGRASGARPQLARATRLLVDCNRLRGRGVLSEFSQALPPAQQAALVRRLWQPHWRAVATAVAAAVRGSGAAHHIALHSFSADLAPARRCIDLGLLYDPCRPREVRLAGRLAAALRERLPHLRVRRNAPYRGVADGLPTALRRRLPDAKYVGLEFEVSQALVERADWPRVRASLVAALLQALRPEKSGAHAARPKARGLRAIVD